MRKILIAALIFCSCSPKYDCYERNIFMIGSNDCSGFNAALGRAFTAFGAKTNLDITHGRMAGVWFGISGQAKMTDMWGRTVAGETFCNEGFAQIGTDDWSKSALSHELAHLLQCPYENVDHQGGQYWDWTENHIWEAIDDSNKVANVK